MSDAPVIVFSAHSERFYSDGSCRNERYPNGDFRWKMHRAYDCDPFEVWWVGERGWLMKAADKVQEAYQRSIEELIVGKNDD